MATRRAFIGTAGRLAAGAATALAWRGPGAPAPVSALGAPARTIPLEAREITWELAPGRTVKAMAYNGRVPGPEIRVREGERVRVVLTNRLDEPTTIHWHGIDVPNAMDGVPGITQSPVPPGATFVAVDVGWLTVTPLAPRSPPFG